MAGDGRADEPCNLCCEKGVPLLSQRMRMRWAVFFRFVMGSAPGCERIYNPESVSVCASLCVCVVCCCLLCVCVDYIFAQKLFDATCSRLYHLGHYMSATAHSCASCDCSLADACAWNSCFS